MDNNTMVKVENLGICFNLAKERVDSLKEYFLKFSKGSLHFEEFWALKNVSLEIKKGDFYGLVGINGSGKSTLLKTIAGVFKPTEGSVTVNGTIAPLIELGAGFDMDLTARENIYLNGAVLGFSKQFMDEHFQDIVDFSELHDFLDVPLKNYSSGMVARIAFAIATVTVILLSFVGGLPVGAKMSAELYERGLISKEQFARLLSFCVNPGPAFVISAVGVSMLRSKETGIILYVSLIMSSLFIGILSRYFAPADETYISCTANDNSSKNKRAPFEKAVIKSSKSLFSICAWVTAFSCFNEITANLNISDALRSFILCTSEMTNGSMTASEWLRIPS